MSTQVATATRSLASPTSTSVEPGTDVISAQEVTEYLTVKELTEALHDNLLTRLRKGAVVASDSPVVLYAVRSMRSSVNWESVAKRLALRFLHSKARTYLQRIVRRAPVSRYWQLRSRAAGR